MNNPKNKKLLNDFIKYIENRDILLGWSIISKESYKNYILKHKYLIERPQKNKECFNLFIEWEEISDEELQYQIYLFLKDYEENHDEDWIED